MPDHDLGAQLRAYIDGAAEPVRADEAVARRRRPEATLRAIAVAAVLAAAVVAVGLVVVTRDDDDKTAPARSALDVVPPTSTTFFGPTIPPIPTPTTEPYVAPEVTDKIDVGGDADGIAVVDGTVWVAVSTGPTGGGVVAVDASTRAVTARYQLGARAIDLAADRDALWIAGTRGIERVDPVTGAVTTIEEDGTYFGVVIAYQSVWAVGGGEVVRIDPTRNEVVARVSPVQGVSGIAAGAGSIWLADGNNNDPTVITRIDPASNTVAAEIPVPAMTRRLLATDTAVYATVFLESPGGQEGGVYGVDPATNQFVGHVPGGGWQGITLVGGHVWLVAHGGHVGVVLGNGSIEHVPQDAVGFRSSGDAIAYGAGAVWAPSEETGYLVRVDPGSYD